MNVWRRRFGASFRWAPAAIALVLVLLLLRLVKFRLGLRQGDDAEKLGQTHSKGQTAFTSLVSMVAIPANAPYCSVALRMGSRPSFAMCKRSKGVQPTRNVTLISAESTSIKFERQFVDSYPDAHIFLYGHEELPESSLSALDTDNLIVDEPGIWNYLLSSMPFFGTSTLLDRVIKFVESSVTDNNGVLKLGNWEDNSDLKICLLDYLINRQLMKIFSQLHIWIQVDQNNNALINRWLKIISGLEESGFLHFASQSFGDCTPRETHQSDEVCIFATSWIREEAEPAKLNAAINPLDPNVDLEEHIYQILTVPTLTCIESIKFAGSASSSRSQQSENIFSPLTIPSWSVCLDELKPPCLVYSTGISESVTTFDEDMAKRGCEVHVFDPTGGNSSLADTEIPNSKIQLHHWALGSVNANIVSGFAEGATGEIWKYVKASEVQKKLGHEGRTVDLLRLNLQGGEWDVIQELVTSEKIQNYKQLLVATHLWHGEEAFSLIDRYMRLQKILSSDFQVANSQPLVDSGGKEQRCCHVVGWVNVSM